MKAVFLTARAKDVINAVYAPETMAKLKSELDFIDPVLSANPDELEARKADLASVDYIFSTWGMPRFTKEQIAEYLPNLKAVFYGAGSVQGFARDFIESGIDVFSAWGANAVPVAEVTVSLIVLANKGFFQRMRHETGEGWDRSYPIAFPGSFDNKVGIIGAGMIGRLVIKMLKAYRLKTLVFDPFLPDEAAAELGVEKVSLEELFTECDVISNHLANNAETVGMLNGKLFDLMKPNAAFINTGRGAQVVEADLCRAMREVPTRCAILDVTHPEPPVVGSEFYSCPNIILTPHIAGSIGLEVARMGEFMYEEYSAYRKGEPTKYGVTLKMLETMA